MNKVLKIITKQEFTSLYRFGFLPKDPNRIIVEEESSDSFDDLFIERLMELPYFSGDEEYLLIGLSESKEEKSTIGIEEVIEIIPFTEAAKVSYEQKFDSRIEFQPARFEYLIAEVELKIDVEDKVRGAEALWKILNTEELTEQFVQKEDVEYALKARRNGLKSNEFQENFDTHLLTYDRYEFFPNTFLGYFYDVGEVFAHSIGIPSFIGSEFHKFLESNKEILKEEKLATIINNVEESNEIRAFKKKCSKDGLSLYLAGVLFFKFKGILIENESINETKISEIVEWIKENKPYVNELNYAIYLTGVFFGYSKFYSDLYEYEGLPIFGVNSRQKLESNDDHQIDKHFEDREEVVEDQENVLSGNDDEVKEEEELQKQVEESQVSTANQENSLGVKEIKGQLTQILDNEPNKTKKLEGDFLIHLKNILSEFTETDFPLRDECIEVLKKEFSDIIEFKSPIVIGIKQKSELKLDI